MAPELDDRTRAQLRFLVEADKLKSILRANPEARSQARVVEPSSSRRTPSRPSGFAAGLGPEHRPGEGAAARLDRTGARSSRVSRQRSECQHGRATKAAREAAAADRLFALLPPDQAVTWRAWWDEFEAAATPEARLARAVDSLAPLIVNHASGGQLWREKGRTEADVRARNARLEAWAPSLVPVVDALVADAVARGWFAEPA